jgi:hypothetical protein
MRRCAVRLLVCLSTLTGYVQPAHASDHPGALIDGGTVGLSFRYRYEHVDDDAFDKDADASTLRSRLSLQSGEYRNLGFLIEVEDIREIIADHFDAGAGNTPGRREFPVVADPEGTEVNQAYVDYQGLADTRLRLGRQRINLDNQRFVGGVGWRQNEQTFDALSVDYTGNHGNVFYALVDNVNRVSGEDVPAGDHRQDPSHLLNLSTGAGLAGRVSAYHYAIDNRDVPALSTRTTGFRMHGGRELVELTVDYLAEYARQSDLGNNPVSYHADYWHLNAGVTIAGLSVSAGWEVLTGNANRSGEAFQTPLATLHAFNGWADQFLNTPDGGLEDRYMTMSVAPGFWTVEARAHRFHAEDGGADYGNEIDLRVGRSFGAKVQLDLFAAAFDGDGGFNDVTKLWLMLSARI